MSDGAGLVLLVLAIEAGLLASYGFFKHNDAVQIAALICAVGALIVAVFS